MTLGDLGLTVGSRLAWWDYHPIGAAILTDTAPGVSDPLTGLLTYGPLGIMVVALATGIFVPGPTHNRVVKENERLRELIDNKVYPAIESSTAAVRESNETIKEALRVMPSSPPRRQAGR